MGRRRENCVLHSFALRLESEQHWFQTARKCVENAHNIYSTHHKAVAVKDSWHYEDLTQLSQEMRGFLPNGHMIIKSISEQSGMLVTLLSVHYLYS